MFTKKVDNSSVGLQKRSSGILNIFKKTVEDLKVINDNAAIEMANQEVIIAAAEVEHASLNKLMTSNANVINNINTFLGHE